MPDAVKPAPAALVPRADPAQVWSMLRGGAEALPDACV